jgi:hypothetical protein
MSIMRPSYVDICPSYVDICPDMSLLQPYHTQIKRCSFCVTYRWPTNSPGWAHLVVSYQDGRHVPLQGRKWMITRRRKQTVSWQKPAKAYLFSVFILSQTPGFMFRNHKESVPMSNSGSIWYSNGVSLAHNFADVQYETIVCWWPIRSGRSWTNWQVQFQDLLKASSSDPLRGIFFWHPSDLIWQRFWHTSWHVISHCCTSLPRIYSDALSISQTFWHSIWHFVWHSFWHSIWHFIWHFMAL